MKFITNSLSVIIMTLLFASCEEIVDIDLKSAAPKYVIDATISENMECIVTITKSQAFRDNSSYEKISGAVIELTDESGNSEIVKERIFEPGVYSSEMKGVIHTTYRLKVTIDDVVAEASGTIPQAIPIEETYIYEIKVGSSSWYSPSFIFNDPIGEENYYYTILTINDRTMKTIYLHNDEYRNGKKVHKILFFNRQDNNDEDLKTGDYAQIEMQAIDKGAYTYYKSFSSVAAGGATNPLSNFSGNVLGCFKAYNPSFGYLSVSVDAIYPGD